MSYWHPKMKAYILANWSAYSLVDSEEKMKALLNILEACNENLDTLHDVCSNYAGHCFFCGILGEWENDKDVANTLFEYFRFFPSANELADYLKEMSDEPLKIAWKQFRSDIICTEDGYVLDMRC